MAGQSSHRLRGLDGWLSAADVEGNGTTFLPPEAISEARCHSGQHSTNHETPAPGSAASVCSAHLLPPGCLRTDYILHLVLARVKRLLGGIVIGLPSRL